jgi:hypothetical protein
MLLKLIAALLITVSLGIPFPVNADGGSVGPTPSDGPVLNTRRTRAPGDRQQRHGLPSLATRDIDARTAQADRAGSWDALGTLQNGRRVSVTTDQERDIKGRLKTASPDVLVIVEEDRRDRMVRREDIREVRAGPRYGAGLYAGLGLLVGVVGGTIAARDLPSDSNATAAYPLGAALMGGVVGYTVGSGLNGHPWRVVYERSARTSARVTVSPVVNRNYRGARLTIGF